MLITYANKTCKKIEELSTALLFYYYLKNYIHATYHNKRY